MAGEYYFFICYLPARGCTAAKDTLNEISKTPGYSLVTKRNVLDHDHLPFFDFCI